VKIYKDPVDPAQHNPDMTFKAEAGPKLAPILRSFARKYSPVSSKFYSFYLTFIN
jgi:hypothetical protein